MMSMLQFRWLRTSLSLHACSGSHISFRLRCSCCTWTYWHAIAQADSVGSRFWNGQLILDMEKTWLHIFDACGEQGVPNHVVRACACWCDQLPNIQPWARVQHAGLRGAQLKCFRKSSAYGPCWKIFGNIIASWTILRTIVRLLKFCRVDAQRSGGARERGFHWVDVSSAFEALSEDLSHTVRYTKTS